MPPLFILKKTCNSHTFQHILQLVYLNLWQIGLTGNVSCDLYPILIFRWRYHTEWYCMGFHIGHVMSIIYDFCLPLLPSRDYLISVKYLGKYLVCHWYNFCRLSVIWGLKAGLSSRPCANIDTNQMSPSSPCYVLRSVKYLRKTVSYFCNFWDTCNLFYLCGTPCTD